MGTPFRSKAFHDVAYGDLRDNTLPDQVAGMTTTGAAFPVDRPRACGHLRALRRRLCRRRGNVPLPRFFQGGHCRIRQPRSNGDTPTTGARNSSVCPGAKRTAARRTTLRTPRVSSENLKGHLLLMHGTLDDNVPPYLTLLLVDSLIKANKDFDLLMLPNQHHSIRGRRGLLRDAAPLGLFRALSAGCRSRRTNTHCTGPRTPSVHRPIEALRT